MGRRIFVDNIKGEEIILDDDQLHHLKNVLRIKEQELVECIHQDKLYSCTFSKNKLSISKISCLPGEDKKITLCLAFSSIPVLEEVLESCTELGVTDFIFFKGDLSNALNFKKGLNEARIQRFQKIIKISSEQSNRNRLPSLKIINDLNELSNFDVGFFGKPLLTTDTKKDLQIPRDSVEYILVVGPEGGLSDKEEELCRQRGFKPISIGSSILRVKTACISLVALLRYYI